MGAKWRKGEGGEEKGERREEGKEIEDGGRGRSSLRAKERRGRKRRMALLVVV